MLALSLLSVNTSKQEKQYPSPAQNQAGEGLDNIDKGYFLRRRLTIAAKASKERVAEAGSGTITSPFLREST